MKDFFECPNCGEIDMYEDFNKCFLGEKECNGITSKEHWGRCQCCVLTLFGGKVLEKRKVNLNFQAITMKRL